MSTQNPDGPGLDRKGLPTSPVMQCFWDLASINDNERREAVRRLVAHAAEAQQSFEQIGSIASGLPSSESGAGDALGLCSDVHYALKRLTKGVHSSHKAAREGFCLALTSLLVAIPKIRTDVVVTKLQEAVGNVTASRLSTDEKRDAILGRLFGYVAILRANRFASHQSFTSKEAFTSCCVSVVTDILALRKSKSWLLEFASEVLFGYIQCIPLNVLNKSLLSVLLPVLGETITFTTPPDALALGFVLLRRLQQGSNTSTLPAGLRSLVKHLAPGQLGVFTDALTHSCASFPRLHIVWAHFLQWFADHGAFGSVTASASSDVSGAALFREFWALNIDENLLKSTNEKRASALLLFSSVVRRVDAATLHSMITQPLVQTWLTHLSKKGNLLHSASQTSVASLIKACSGDSEKSARAVALLLAHGEGNFDKRSGSRVVSSLVNNISESELAEVVKQVHVTGGTEEGKGGKKKSSSNDSDSDSDDDDDDDSSDGDSKAAGRLSWAIQALSSDGRNFRVVHRLYDALTKSDAVASISDDAGKPNWISEEDEAVRQSTIAFADRLLQACALLDAEPADATVVAVLDTLPLKRVLLSKQANAFAQLLLHASSRFILSSGEHGAGSDASSDELDNLRSALDDLLQCAETLCSVQLQVLDARNKSETPANGVKGKSNKAKGKGKVARAVLPSTEDKVKAMNVFVDVLLSMLSSPVRLTRDVVKTTFRHFASECTPECIDVLMQSIMPTRGKGKKHDNEDDDDDVKMVDDDEVEHSHSHDDDSEHEDKDDEKESDDDDEDDDEDDDDEDGKGSEEDDELAEMRKYDEKLAEMLRQRRSKKADAKAAAVAAEHFRFRALDLVETALLQAASTHLLFQLLGPLLKVLRVCTGRTADERGLSSLRGRLCAMIEKAGKLKPPHVTDDGSFTPAVALGALSTLLEQAVVSRGNDVMSALANVGWLLVRSLRVGGSVALPAGSVTDSAIAVGKLYGECAAKFLTTKSCDMTSKIFVDFAQRAPVAAVHMLTPLLTAVASAHSVYRITQALTAVEAMLKFGPCWDALTPDTITLIFDTLGGIIQRSLLEDGDTKLDLDAKKLRPILSLARLVAQKGKRTGSRALIEAVQNLKSKSTSPPLVQLCNSVLTLSGVTVQAPAKGQSEKGFAGLQSDDDEGDEDGDDGDDDKEVGNGGAGKAVKSKNKQAPAPIVGKKRSATPVTKHPKKSKS